MYISQHYILENNFEKVICIVVGYASHILVQKINELDLFVNKIEILISSIIYLEN